MPRRTGRLAGAIVIGVLVAACAAPAASPGACRTAAKRRCNNQPPRHAGGVAQRSIFLSHMTDPGRTQACTGARADRRPRSAQGGRALSAFQSLKVLLMIWVARRVARRRRARCVGSIGCMARVVVARHVGATLSV